MNTVYKKRGRKYEPVGVMEELDIKPYGYYLVKVEEGCTTTRYDVEPATAPLLAAMLEHEDAVIDEVLSWLEGRPTLSAAQAARALFDTLLRCVEKEKAVLLLRKQERVAKVER